LPAGASVFWLKNLLDEMTLQTTARWIVAGQRSLRSPNSSPMLHRTAALLAGIVPIHISVLGTVISSFSFRQ
jgi:hypothetical protein